MSPLNVFGPEVTVKTVLTVAPGAICSVNLMEVSVEFKTTEFHPLGPVMLNVRSFTGAPVVFVNVTVVF
jgi:hypothetical protein